MKILILSDFEAGGEWIATQTLIKKLKKKDKSLNFYLITSTENTHLIKKSLFEKVIYFKKKYYKKPFKHYRELFYLIKEEIMVIGKAFQENKFDRTIATDYLLAVSYLISQKRLDYIFYFHGLKNYSKLFFDNFNPYVIFQRFLEILAWTTSKKIVIPSINAKDILTRYSLSLLKKEWLIVIPNLIRDEFSYKYPKINDKNEKIILYSGRLDPNKGIRHLLFAFLELTKRYPELILAIAYCGKPDIKLLNELKTFINKGKKIKIVNNTNVSNLIKLYRSASLGILPSSLEISSLFIREALMCNLPIIATKTGDTGKILSKYFLLKDDGADIIADKIESFIVNEHKYRKYFLIDSENFRSQFNEVAIVDSWVKIIKNNEK